ncbi:MAG: sialidase family protein [Paludibacter sp.]|nr:sialidase family protein [Paludibacter sp.]
MKNSFNKIINGLLLLIVFCMVLISSFSCSGQADPSIKNLEAFNFYNSGNDQRGFSGQYLNESLVVGYNQYILNQDCTIQRLHVHFEVITGGGSIDNPDQDIPVNGSVYTKWKTGTATNDQKVTASLFDNSGKLLTRITFTALAFQPGRWDEISGLQNAYLNDMATDTVNHLTFMIIGATLYTEGENYFDWKKVEITGNQIYHSLEIDKKGTLYIGSWEGKLFKSTDHGKSFTECTKPIPGYNGYFELILTSDNTIWVSRFNYPLRFSTDGGNTWKVSESGLNNSSQSIDVFRLSTGKFITLSFDNISLLESTDGIHWLPVNNNTLYTARMHVTDKDEIIVMDVASNANIMKSVDAGKTFLKEYSHSVTYGTSPMRNIFSSYKGVQYICMPGAGILKTTDFNSFELFYSNIYIRGLMVDHNGVLFATNKDFNKVYCYK